MVVNIFFYTELTRGSTELPELFFAQRAFTANTGRSLSLLVEPNLQFGSEKGVVCAKIERKLIFSMHDVI